MYMYISLAFNVQHEFVVDLATVDVGVVLVVEIRQLLLELLFGDAELLTHHVDLASQLSAVKLHVLTRDPVSNVPNTVLLTIIPSQLVPF